MCPPINLSDILFFVEYLQENYKKKLKITFFCGILTFGKTENSLESVFIDELSPLAKLFWVFSSNLFITFSFHLFDGTANGY